MEGIYFALALFVFGLVCAVLFVWKKVYLSIKAPNQFEREVNWAKRYQDLENRVDAFEAYVDEVQEDIRQEKRELRRMVAQAEEIYRKLSGGQDIDAPVIVTLGANKPLADYVGHMRKKDIPEPPVEEPITEPEPPMEEPIAEDDLPNNTMELIDAEPDESPAVREEETEEEVFPDDADEAEPDAPEDEVTENSRNADVLWMHRTGFSDDKIAQQLGITRNEVKLILELWED